MVRGSKNRRAFLSLVTGSATVGLAGCFGGGGNGNGNGSGDSNGDSSDGGDSGDEDPEEEVPEADETVLVGPDGDLRFDPETLEIDPGTTVGFVWESGGHNILTGSIPDDAEWEGARSTEDEGYTHTHTFEVEGVYEYRCGQHQFQGMDGKVVVGDVETGEDGDGNGADNETDGSDGGDGNETDGDGNETDGDGNETDGSADDGNESDDDGY